MATAHIAALTADQIESLRWYSTRANHGRGRMSKESAMFVRLGYLNQAWTSMNCWVLTLSCRGKALLETL
jgi:hypothetical protein